MTLEEAQARAAARTAAGVPTRVRKDVSSPGGWRSVTRASVAKSHATYNTSQKGKARDAAYNTSARGKACTRRAKLGRDRIGGVSQNRLNEHGGRFREEDLLALRDFQSGKCFVLRVPLDGTTRNGAKLEHVDHRHADGYVRALLHRDVNLVAGLLEKHGLTTYDKLIGFATRMAALFDMPWIALPPGAKARARRRSSPTSTRSRRRTS